MVVPLFLPRCNQDLHDDDGTSGAPPGGLFTSRCMCCFCGWTDSPGMEMAIEVGTPLGFRGGALLFSDVPSVFSLPPLTFWL